MKSVNERERERENRLFSLLFHPVFLLTQSLFTSHTKLCIEYLEHFIYYLLCGWLLNIS